MIEDTQHSTFTRNLLDHLHRLSQLQRDARIGKLSEDELTPQKLEILMALKKLMTELTPDEQLFIERHAGNALQDFDQVTDTVACRLLDVAGSQLKAAQS